MHYINAHGREDLIFSPPTQSEILGNNNETNTPFTPGKHVLLNWFSLNENYKQRTEKLDFPLDSSTC